MAGTGPAGRDWPLARPLTARRRAGGDRGKLPRFRGRRYAAAAGRRAAALPRAGRGPARRGGCDAGASSTERCRATRGSSGTERSSPSAADSRSRRRARTARTALLSSSAKQSTTSSPASRSTARSSSGPAVAQPAWRMTVGRPRCSAAQSTAYLVKRLAPESAAAAALATRAAGARPGCPSTRVTNPKSSAAIT